MIKFIIMVNKQGQTRLGQYFFDIPMKERITLEGELVRKCLSRSQNRVLYLYPVLLPRTPKLQDHLQEVRQSLLHNGSGH